MRLTSNRTLILAALTAALFATGCAADQSGVPDGRDLQQQLGVPTPLTLVAGDSAAMVNDKALPLGRGEIELWSPVDGVLSIESLVVEVEDVTVDEPGSPLHGLTITDMRISLDRPIDLEAEWTAFGDAAVADVSADLRLDWTLQTEAGPLELAPQRVSDVSLSLRVYLLPDGRLVAELLGGLDGEFWSWGEEVWLRDLRLDLRAETGIVE